MQNKKKILYVEDMKECYENTSRALGGSFEIDWKKNYSEALNAIKNNFEQYSAGVFDVNLDYKPGLPMSKQSTEGFALMNLAREEREKKNIRFPILCASKNWNYKEGALKNGADLFFYKKEFWEKGKALLEELVKKV